MLMSTIRSLPAGASSACRPGVAQQVCQHLLVLLALAATPSCQQEVQPFEIRLDFTSAGSSPSPCPGPCEAIPLSCQSMVSIRVVDPADPAHLLDEKCVLLPVNEPTTMCALGTIEVPLTALPVGTAHIEVALWDASLLEQTNGGACPEQPIFDLRGFPLPTVNPQPAVAGAVYFDVGSAPSVSVPLSCPDWQQVNQVTCQPPALSVALVDMERGQRMSQTDVPPGLEVRYALPARTSGGGWVLPETETSRLQRRELGEIAGWEGTLDQPLDATDPLCIVVRESPTSTPVVSCVSRGDTAAELEIDALYLPQAVIDGILDAAALGAVPAEGLVVGRVVAADTGAAVAGVVVEPTHDPTQAAGVERSDVPVAYLSEDRSTIQDDAATTSNGYFLSISVPFPSAWQAVRDADGAIGDAAPYHGGRIQDVINAIRVELGSAPPMSTPAATALPAM